MNDLFFTPETELNEDQKNQLIEILTKRCGSKTYNIIKSILTYDLSIALKDIYSLRRFYVSENGEVHYCAGQSYPCEIKSIRNEIMKKYT